MWGLGRDHLVEPPANSSAWNDPGRSEHSQSRHDPQHPAGTQWRAHHAPRLTCQKVKNKIWGKNDKSCYKWAYNSSRYLAHLSEDTKKIFFKEGSNTIDIVFS